MIKEKKNLINQFKKLSNEVKNNRLNHVDKISRIQACLALTSTLAKVSRYQDEDPYPILEETCFMMKSYLKFANQLENEIVESDSALYLSKGLEHTKELFEQAWTCFSNKTYEESIDLVMNRLKKSGIDKSFLKDKVCFDGGCGTGRLSIALSRLGAKKIIAADIGNRSLDFLEEKIKERNIKNITTKKMDITDLREFNDESFDFVASYGVLHHTENCSKGLAEHFRIVKRGGGVFFVYLYGQGGLYWEIYDICRNLLKNISPEEIRSYLLDLKVREGLIYTLIDNLTAPRVYYSRKKFFSDISANIDSFDWRLAKGVNYIDDTEMVLKSNYGQLIYGPEGEIRLVLQKK